MKTKMEKAGNLCGIPVLISDREKDKAMQEMECWLTQCHIRKCKDCIKNKKVIYILVRKGDPKTPVNPFVAMPGKLFYEKREDAQIYAANDIKVRKVTLEI